MIIRRIIGVVIMAVMIFLSLYGAMIFKDGATRFPSTYNIAGVTLYDSGFGPWEQSDFTNQMFAGLVYFLVPLVIGGIACKLIWK